MVEVLAAPSIADVDQPLLHFVNEELILRVVVKVLHLVNSSTLEIRSPFFLLLVLSIGVYIYISH